jgi:hypothetical protein
LPGPTTPAALVATRTISWPSYALFPLLTSSLRTCHVLRVTHRWVRRAVFRRFPREPGPSRHRYGSSGSSSCYPRAAPDVMTYCTDSPLPCRSLEAGARW